jgi:hypothetical protein
VALGYHARAKAGKGLARGHLAKANDNRAASQITVSNTEIQLSISGAQSRIWAKRQQQLD